MQPAGTWGYLTESLREDTPYFNGILISIKENESLILN